MNIYEAITSIMDEGYSISKGKRNTQQGFMYRGIDDVMNTFQPLMAKNHIFVVPEVLEQTREERVTGKGNTLLYSILRMKYTFYAEDGSNVCAVVVGEGMDSGDKASNKAMAGAMKYAMFQVFCIPTEEMPDPDATTPEPSKSKQAAPDKAQEKAPEQRKVPVPAPRCMRCGGYVVPGKTKDGREWASADIAKYSQRRYNGAVYCVACMKLVDEAEKAVKSQNQDEPA